MTARARVVPDGPEGRAIALEVLRAGGVVALPTDTVYGIAVALSTAGGIGGGPADGGPASTVVDCTGDRAIILRAGAVPVRRVAAILDAARVPHHVGR